MHAPGYVAETTDQAADDFLPVFARAISDIGKERGWPAMTRKDFEDQLGPEGALIVGNPDVVAEKIIRHSKSLGGVFRVTFQMNAASLAHEKIMRAIDLIGTRVIPALLAKLEVAEA